MAGVIRWSGWRFMAVGLIVCVVLTGCDTPAAMRGVAGTPLQLTDKVITKDAVLKRKVRLAKHKAERTEADLLRVRLGMLNYDDDSLWVDIQVTFLDEDGFELEKTNWQPLLLHTGQLTYYDTVSLSARACDYSVVLRNARETEDGE